MQYISSRLSDDGVPAFGFGGDYNPEQWDPSVWVEDVALMAEAGVNLVSVGIFSWALLEPSEGEYEFGWLDSILDLLHSSGIRVDLANASASPPPWFSHKYPQSLPVTATGVRLGYGSRQAFCASSPDYRRAAAALTTAIVDRYASHPAVVMWHVHNEYGCHNQPCYCDESGAAFQRWLEHRYENLDALNAAWGTAFWSQHYYSFSEITPPRLSGTFVNPTHALDFARFSSDELLACFEAEAKIIRDRSPHPVTTNFMGFFMGLDKPLDYAAWAEQMDVVSNDHYLVAEDPRNFQDLAMNSDYVRGLAGGAPWILMEHSTSAVNWQPRNIAKVPGEMLRNAMQHVARGADAVLFFQWRAAEAGSEKFHSAMLPHSGTDSRVWREVVELGAALRSISELVGSRVSDAPVAIIHDADSRWASELDSHPSTDLSMMAETRLWHDALYRAQVTTDFRAATDDLSSYRAVIVPMQYLMTDAGADNIRAFAEAGGTVVVTYFSGIVDEDNHVRLGGYPGAFTDLLGVRIEEFYPLRENETTTLSRFGVGRIFSELGRSAGAEVLAEYAEGPTAGSPAVTRRAVGSGFAYYVGTSLSETGVLELLETIAIDADLAIADSPAGDLEIVRRSNGEDTWLFAINHGASAVSVTANGTDLLTGEATAGRLELRGGGVAVIRENRTTE
ncbi:beta-galactosidase [Salinibacterium sp. G-O1]|uniref:beta-galactosidase n=1 Tax=Salinibacterium sp. G-O1 TaxID=3046208 RepID=UPI0024BA662B|nr:beta-galactosidase [Salinibacterium sp. G-O1]MDJ0334326.1 beta-galactosidase [Salinibacterium sp. G-O1]